MIFSENRYPLFRIMLSFVWAWPFRKTGTTFPDHALDAERAAQICRHPRICLAGWRTLL